MSITADGATLHQSCKKTLKACCCLTILHKNAAVAVDKHRLCGLHLRVVLGPLLGLSAAPFSPFRRLLLVRRFLIIASHTTSLLLGCSAWPGAEVTACLQHNSCCRLGMTRCAKLAQSFTIRFTTVYCSPGILALFQNVSLLLLCRFIRIAVTICPVSSCFAHAKL